MHVLCIDRGSEEVRVKQRIAKLRIPSVQFRYTK